ncbi:MAG: hypothetical protein IPH94_20420 [Saprospiraceae bacterium]|nr:hypothetical protein [Saprospiraceae bacterium]
MTQVDMLEVFLNRNLSICNIENICAYLANCQPAVIFRNSGDCEDLASVQAACNLAVTSSSVQSTACDSFSLNGITYYESGYFFQTLPSHNPEACDSSILIQLTVYQKDTTELNIAACDSFTYLSEVLHDSGTYVFDLVNAFGCDSTIVLNLTLNNSITSNLAISTCVEFSWRGNLYTESGIYADTLVTSTGCDSIIVLDLTIIPGTPTYDTLQIKGCDSVVVNSLVYFQSGSYEQLLTNGFGCDSILTIEVEIAQPSSSTVTAEVCQSYILNGIEYFESGTFTQVLTNAVGCDSIVTLELTIKEGSNSYYEITDSACELYLFNGEYYLESGTYQADLINQFGCDSTVVLNLTIYKSDRDTISVEACEMVVVNNVPYFNSGTYTQFLLTTQGCDSTLTVNVVINPGFNTTELIEDTVCGSYTLNGEVYTTSGTYTQKLTNVAGCDSTLTLAWLFILFTKILYMEWFVTPL